MPGPSDINANGHIFGGWVLSQMDIAAGIVASRRAKGPVATVAIEAMKFIAPIHLRDLISVYAEVERVGRTSMGVRIEVDRASRPRRDRGQGHRRTVHLRRAGRGPSSAAGRSARRLRPPARSRLRLRRGARRAVRRRGAARLFLGRLVRASSRPIAGGSTSNGMVSPPLTRAARRLRRAPRSSRSSRRCGGAARTARRVRGAAVARSWRSLRSRTLCRSSDASARRPRPSRRRPRRRRIIVALAARILILEARAAFAEHAEIMVRELQIIFGLDAVARELRVARHALVFFEQLGGIAALAIVLAVARLSAEVPAPPCPPRPRLRPP